MHSRSKRNSDRPYQRRLEWSEVIAPTDRVIQSGLLSFEVCRALLKNGIVLGKYIGLSTTSARATKLSEEPDFETFKQYCFTASSPQQVYRNSTDTLILSGASSAHAWFPHRCQHTKQTLVQCKFLSPYFWLATAGILRGIFLQKWQIRGHVRACNELYVVLGITRPVKKGARRYIPPGIGARGFFERLNEKGCKYALLRWFESETERDPKEDYDILIADEALPVIDALLSERPGTIPCDLFTVSGSGEMEFNKVPYLPPLRASELLESVVKRGVYKVPDPLFYFLSLAYHAIYHKGYASGLVSKYTHSKTKEKEHEYPEILRNLVKDLSIDVEVTLEGLESHLSGVGWRPSYDVLRKLSLHNSWINDHFKQELQGETDGNDILKQPGLTVFLIRETAVRNNQLNWIRGLIEREGFYILLEKRLDDEEQAKAAANIRGGNWGKGPWLVSGGPPVVYMIAYDLIPKQLNEIEALQYPHNDNARVLVKRRIREAANRDLPLNEQCNVLHASDNSSESLEYIGLLSPSTINDIRGQVTRLHEKFRTRRRVVRSLTGSGRRAKIELVEYNGKLAVQKTFRPGAEKYLLREKFALEKLSVGCPYIPKLIESGNNYVVMPYYGQKVSTRLGLLSLNSVQAVFETMRYLYSKDYFWGDANPNNLRLDDNGNIKLIDYEFLQEYRERPATFSESYDLVLLPLDFQYDLPGLRLRKDGGGYSDLWKPYTGLDLDDVLHASRWKQHLKRAWYRVSLLPLSALLKTTTRLYVRVRKIFILTFGKFVQSSLDIAVDRILSRLLI